MKPGIATSVVWLSAVLLAGCSPEKDCRDAIKLVKPRVYGAINTGGQRKVSSERNSVSSHH